MNKYRRDRRRGWQSSLELLEGRILLNLDFDFAAGLGGANLTVNDVATDSQGNFYLTGAFAGTVDFDPGPGTFNLSSVSAQEDAFAAKYSATGDLEWAVAVGNNGTNTSNGIAVDGAGNSYITGFFSGSLLGMNIGQNFGIFVVKFDPNGAIDYTSAAPGTGANLPIPQGISVDAAGNAVVVGGFPSTVTFGDTALTASSSQDIFAARLDTAGNFVWAEQFAGQGTNFSQANAVALDDSGNILIAGDFQGTVDFNPGAGTFSRTSAGSADAFMAKLDAGGGFVYAATFGGTDFDTASAIATDAAGGAYALGRFSGTVDFNPGAGVTDLTAAGTSDFFVVRLGPTGGFGFATNIGIPGTDDRLGTGGIAVDDHGSVFVAASLEGSVTLAGETLTSAGGNDLLLVEYDTAGNVIAARRGGGTGEVGPNGLALGPNKALSVAGFYTETATIGTTTLPDIGAVNLFFTRVLDTTGPSILGVVQPTPAPNVATVDLAFSEPIALSSFTSQDLTLTRNGTNVPLNGVTTSFLSGTAYRISGLSALTSTPGTYTLTVNAAGIVDGAGNAGTGSASTTFTVTDSPPPNGQGPIVQEIVSVDSPRSTPVQSVDVILSKPADLATFTFADVSLTRDNANVPLDNSVTVALVSGSTYRVSGLSGFTAGSGTYVVTVNGAGISDPEGNAGSGSASTSFTVVVAGEGPVVLNVDVNDAVPTARRSAKRPVESAVVSFSESVNLNSFNFNDLTLTRNGQPVALDNRVTIVSAGITGTFTINGLTEFTRLPGTYVLTVSGAGVTNGGGQAGAGIAFDTFTVLSSTPADFDGDGITDLAVFHRDTANDVGIFEITLSSTGETFFVELGRATDFPAVGDFNGDGKTNVGVYGFYPELGFSQFVHLPGVVGESLGEPETLPFGGQGDFPIIGDYDGDGIDDFAVYGFSPLEGFSRFGITYSANPGEARSIPFGGLLDFPVAGDFDGDGITDLAVYGFSPLDGFSRFGILHTNGTPVRPTETGSAPAGAFLLGFGGLIDAPVVGDFDGDGIDDLAVFGFSPDDGFSRFGILQSNGAPILPINGQTPPGAFLVEFGGDDDVPVGGDFSGNGRTDFAVYGFGRYAIIDSATGQASSVNFGRPGDIPVPTFSGLFQAGGSAQDASFAASRGMPLILLTPDTQGGTTDSNGTTASKRTNGSRFKLVDLAIDLLGTESNERI